ncbi:hypothetical protein [Alteromonas sp. ASW11-130]|uniref:hypothetical protein n=1 Tax=Alteromonas sp. ASW11-130 TaxID=3015775 RepID=UPI002242AB87|nr:hypothetical protein [Alteromonas sp. ASW11-130]MCW8090489.1 hypothetical protein [Alteromonas sp. ASW11-130]
MIGRLSLGLIKLDMANTIQFLKAWIVASLVAFVLAAVMHTQMVLIGLVNIDININVSDWLLTTFQDIWGLLPTYAPVIGLALFIAMIVVVIFAKFIAAPALLSFIGGGMAIFTVLVTMQPIMHITLIAGAREPVGFALQCLSGAVGGLVFAKLYYR